MTKDENLALTLGPTVEASTDVVLTDGATINIKVRVSFKTTPQPESTIRIAVADWFYGDGSTTSLTLLKLRSNLNFTELLRDKLKGLLDATNASIMGYSVLTPPIPWFEEKSKKVTAILASGETIKLRVASPPGANEPPSVFDISKMYELLSSLKFSQLNSIQKLLNEKLRNPDRGWDYLVLGLEQASCPCTHA